MATWKSLRFNFWLKYVYIMRVLFLNIFKVQEILTKLRQIYKNLCKFKQVLKTVLHNFFLHNHWKCLQTRSKSHPPPPTVLHPKPNFVAHSRRRFSSPICRDFQFKKWINSGGFAMKILLYHKYREFFAKASMAQPLKFLSFRAGMQRAAPALPAFCGEQTS